MFATYYQLFVMPFSAFIHKLANLLTQIIKRFSFNIEVLI